MLLRESEAPQLLEDTTGQTSTLCRKRRVVFIFSQRAAAAAAENRGKCHYYTLLGFHWSGRNGSDGEGEMMEMGIPQKEGGRCSPANCHLHYIPTMTTGAKNSRSMSPILNQSSSAGGCWQGPAYRHHPREKRGRLVTQLSLEGKNAHAALLLSFDTCDPSDPAYMLALTLYILLSRWNNARKALAIGG